MWKMLAIYLLFHLALISSVLTNTNDQNETLLSSLSTFLKFLERYVDEVRINVENKQCPEKQDDRTLSIDCADVYKGEKTKSGIYRIWPKNWEQVGSFEVYCDMTDGGGGWTLIQKRAQSGNPRDFFLRQWKDYRNGFGDLSKEFWLGNERLFSLTNQRPYTLRIVMKDEEGNSRHALYNNFWIENEDQDYKLHVSEFSGDAGDSFGNLNRQKFSTTDRDNDIHTTNCATTYKGAWWYSNCHSSNLNGMNYNGFHDSYADGINWRTWKSYNYSLTEVEMKIRPSNF